MKLGSTPLCACPRPTLINHTSEPFYRRYALTQYSHFMDYDSNIPTSVGKLKAIHMYVYIYIHMCFSDLWPISIRSFPVVGRELSRFSIASDLHRRDSRPSVPVRRASSGGRPCIYWASWSNEAWPWCLDVFSVLWMSMGVPIVMGVTPIAGWFLLGEIPI